MQPAHARRHGAYLGLQVNPLDTGQGREGVPIPFQEQNSYVALVNSSAHWFVYNHGCTAGWLSNQLYQHTSVVMAGKQVCCFPCASMIYVPLQFSD